MGLVRILVDANWNFRCSGQRVSVDWLRDGDRSSSCVCPSVSSGLLPALQTVLSEEDVARFIESF